MLISNWIVGWVVLMPKSGYRNIWLGIGCESWLVENGWKRGPTSWLRSAELLGHRCLKVILHFCLFAPTWRYFSYTFIITTLSDGLWWRRVWQTFSKADQVGMRGKEEWVVQSDLSHLKDQEWSQPWWKEKPDLRWFRLRTCSTIGQNGCGPGVALPDPDTCLPGHHRSADHTEAQDRWVMWIDRNLR